MACPGPWAEVDARPVCEVTRSWTLDIRRDPFHRNLMPRLGEARSNCGDICLSLNTIMSFKSLCFYTLRCVGSAVDRIEINTKAWTIMRYCGIDPVGN